jgi:hypothetical protein
MHDTPLLSSKQCTIFFRVAESETAEASNVSARGVFVFLLCSLRCSAAAPLRRSHPTCRRPHFPHGEYTRYSLVRTPGEMDGWMLEWWRGAAGTRDRESECLECFMVSDGDCDGDARSSEPDSTDRPAPAAFSRARRHVARLPTAVQDNEFFFHVAPSSLRIHGQND